MISQTYSPRNTLEDVLSSNSQAAKNAAKAGAFTSGLGFLVREGYKSANTMATTGAILKSTIPSVLAFGGLTYGMSLMQNAKSPTGKLEGLAITAASAIPAYSAVVKIAPIILNKLYIGLGAALKGSYAVAMPYLATVGAGLFLGYSLLKGIIGSIKRMAGDYIGKYFNRDEGRDDDHKRSSDRYYGGRGD